MIRNLFIVVFLLLQSVAVWSKNVGFKAVMVVGNLNGDYASLLQEQKLRGGLTILKKAGAFDSMDGLLVFTSYNFYDKKDSEALRQLKVSDKNLPRLLLVEFHNSKPTKVIWGKSVKDTRADINSLLKELALAPVPSELALTETEELTLAAKKAAEVARVRQAWSDAEYELKDLEKQVRRSLESALIPVNSLPEVWRPGDSRYWSPHQGVGYDNERTYLFRTAYTEYEIIYPPLNTGYRERRSFRNIDSWQVDLAKAEERFSKADSKLHALEEKCSELSNVGVDEASGRWRQACSELREQIQRAKTECSRRVDLVEELLRRYHLPSFRQSGRAIITY